jgi:hypothetical protein
VSQTHPQSDQAAGTKKMTAMQMAITNVDTFLNMLFSSFPKRKFIKFVQLDVS